MEKAPKVSREKVIPLTAAIKARVESSLRSDLLLRWLVSHLCVCAQSCPTLCNSLDCSPPGSSVHGILQAGILEWVAISYCRAPLYALNQKGGKSV